MQQVPNPECISETSAAATNHEASRWSRIPRVQLLRNKNDQRVPLYFDQTVPVWSLREPIRGHSANASSSARSPVAISDDDSRQELQLQQRRGNGVAKASRKWVASSQTVWFRSIKGILKLSSAEAHACNVGEILRDLSCEASESSVNPSKWSGIEQDLFTCTLVDPKVFAVPTAADFISNKKSRSKSKE